VRACNRAGDAFSALDGHARLSDRIDDLVTL